MVFFKVWAANEIAYFILFCCRLPIFCDIIEIRDKPNAPYYFCNGGPNRYIYDYHYHNPLTAD